MGEQVTPLTIDSARLYLATLGEGMQGATRHGAPDRWDWGATGHSLLTAQDEHRRREALVASMTPEQRAALWADPSPEAAALRRASR